jgi:hypothetical protein
MSAIYGLVQKTLEMGYLSVETEQQLQSIVGVGCSIDDSELLMMLKQAIAFGHVKRQAKEPQPLEFKCEFYTHTLDRGIVSSANGY